MGIFGKLSGEKKVAAPVPVELEKGEKELRRVDGVKVELGLMVGRGFLLLTNRRLICNGRFEKVGKEKIGKERIPFSFEWSLDDLVDCATKKASQLGKKRLALAFTQMDWKSFSDGKVKATVHKGGPAEVRSPDGKVLDVDVCLLTGIEQPETLKAEIMEQVHARINQ
jgi:hypothetical protein